MAAWSTWYVVPCERGSDRNIWISAVTCSLMLPVEVATSADTCSLMLPVEVAISVETCRPRARCSWGRASRKSVMSAEFLPPRVAFSLRELLAAEGLVLPEVRLELRRGRISRAHLVREPLGYPFRLLLAGRRLLVRH